MSQFKNATFKSKITQDSIGKNVRRHDGRSSIKDLGAGDSFYVHDFIDPQFVNIRAFVMFGIRNG